MQTSIFFPLGYMIIFVTIIFGIISFINQVLVKKEKNKDKQEVYESGSKSVRKARDSISSELYILTVLFLVFDIEILYLLPPALAYKNLVVVGGLFFFIFMLGLGFIYEWGEGSFSFIGNQDRKYARTVKGLGVNPIITL